MRKRRPVESRAMVSLKVSTKRQLEEIGNMRDSYDDVVQKLITYWNENH